MKTRTLLLSGSLLLVPGSAAAVPTPAVPERPAETAPAPNWDELRVHATPPLLPPAADPTSMELAVFGPCGCTPIPGCPLPIPLPWPPGGPTIFNPLPIPNPCCPSPF